MPLLEIRRVTRRFGDFTAVDDVSFAVEPGEFFTLLGPSGCGKTTLLRMIAGFDLPDAGQILLDGRDLADTPAERRPVHTVFQNFALFPHLSVARNVAFPLRMAGLGEGEVKRRTADALDMVHLGELAEHYPHEISGGQKQRVALARGLVNRPRLLLLDEPLGALDLKLREEMQLELIKLQREVGITFVFVTHAQNEALALSHRIAVMNAGRVEQLDEPSRIYGFPVNRFVADFIGNCNLLEAEVRAVEADGLRLSVAGLGEVRAPAAEGCQTGERGLLALRPEQVQVAAEADPAWANRFPGQVRDFLYVGDVTTYQVRLDNGYTLQALLPNAAPGRARFHETGDRVMVGWSAQAGHYVREA
ncbi:MAG TPA: ABC transporter ATP-binding protein [Thiobacillaceae bacterium]|nr:ABC transporter ATP-binding protein [Thiobacillaceae bacterium]